MQKFTVHYMDIVSWSKAAVIFFFKFSNRSSRRWCELCSELTIKTEHQNDVDSERFSSLL